MTLLVPEDAVGDELVLPWRANSPERRGVSEGTLAIPVERPGLTLEDALALEPYYED